jgi:hypothetical protein
MFRFPWQQLADGNMQRSQEYAKDCNSLLSRLTVPSFKILIQLWPSQNLSWRCTYKSFDYCSKWHWCYQQFFPQVSGLWFSRRHCLLLKIKCCCCRVMRLLYSWSYHISCFYACCTWIFAQVSWYWNIHRVLDVALAVGVTRINL